MLLFGAMVIGFTAWAFGPDGPCAGPGYSEWRREALARELFTYIAGAGCALTGISILNRESIAKRRK